jgi:hypothetical protein
VVLGEDRARVWGELSSSEADVRGTVVDDADFVVPDTDVGWRELISKILTAFETGHGFTYSTMLVRRGGDSLARGVSRLVALLGGLRGKCPAVSDMSALSCALCCVASHAQPKLVLVGAGISPTHEAETYSMSWPVPPGIDGFVRPGHFSEAEAVCMAEVFLPNVRDAIELQFLLFFVYRVCKRASLLPGPEGVSRAIGICISGFNQASEEKLQWLETAQYALRHLDAEHSAMKGLSASKKLTAVRVPGSIAAIAGFTPGTRSMRSSGALEGPADSEMFDACREKGLVVRFAVGADGEVDRKRAVCETGEAFPEVALRAPAEQLSVGRELIACWSADDRFVEVVSGDEYSGAAPEGVSMMRLVRTGSEP